MLRGAATPLPGSSQGKVPSVISFSALSVRPVVWRLQAPLPGAQGDRSLSAAPQSGWFRCNAIGRLAICPADNQLKVATISHLSPGVLSGV
ncbi:hypothetical protein GJAV_G00113360 [Gymnothorax javanicus]|nr:hypothetical protein GJAV_G00113360 [Gymnothorax javanicus]